MKLTGTRAIEILRQLEPRFKEAGKLACSLQAKTKSYQKSNSGHPEADIVTEADGAVQEFVLNAMLNTALSECRLVAEEETPAAQKFNPEGALILTLDPIDGTARYIEGGTLFSIIVGLHDGRVPLYTFDHYPRINWTNTIIGAAYKSGGNPPRIRLLRNARRVIVYPYGEPEKFARDLYGRLTGTGYEFLPREALTAEAGGTALFLTGSVAGYYSENPIAYDGLVALHYAQAMGYQIYASGPGGALNLSTITKGIYGLCHPGYYIAIAQ